MLFKAVKAATGDAQLATRRALRAWSSPRRLRVALTDGHGGVNLGDNVVFEGACRVLGDCSLENYRAVSKERRLATVGLSGSRYFSQYVVGGGTVINHHALGQAKLALDQGLPAWTLGSGAGGAGFKTPHAPDISAWRSVLPRFQAVGVRGPRSEALLRSLGVERCEVVGDLALAMTPDAPVPRAAEPRFAVNVMSRPADGSEPWIPEINEVMARVTSDAAARGWTPVFVALSPQDEGAIRAVMHAAKLAHLPLHIPQSAQQFFEVVGPCAFMLSTRLHGSVLAACAGTQPVAVAYRDKVHDFMESMDLKEYTVGVLDLANLRALAEELTHSTFDRRTVVWERARGYRSALQRYAREQLVRASK